MRILEEEKDAEFISIHIDSDDDLWYLRNIISIGDRVRMTTLRRVEKQQDMTRSKETPRKPVTLTISVESVEFQEFSGSLRVLGTVIAGSDDFLGLHQSFALTPSDTFSLSKMNWSEEQKKLFREALDNIFADRFYFVTIDDEEALILSLKSYGLQNLGKIESHKSGKAYRSDYSEESYVRDVVESLRRMVPDKASLIILGAGFTREKLVQLLRDEHAGHPVKTFPTTRSDQGAVWEFLNSPESDSVLENFRLSGDTRYVDQFLTRLKTTEEATYGYSEVKRALEMGAIDLLLISEDKFRTEEGRDLLEIAKNYATKVHIVSLTGERGQIVKNFGGYCALLRYRISTSQ